MDFKTALLTKHTQLTYDVFELAFQAEDPVFLHEAGQFVTIKIPQPATEPANEPATERTEPLLMRSYSISSLPTAGHFELCIKQVENGRGSNYLSSLKPGDKISFLGPLGHFTFKTQPDQNVLLIATGTGIAPLKSMIEDQLSRKSQETNAGTDTATGTATDTATGSTKQFQQQFTLLFGARHIKDIFYKKELDTLAEKYQNFSYTLTLSQPESPDWETQGGSVGRVTTHLDKLDFSPGKDFDPASTKVYICGLKDMVLQVTEMLQQKGMSKESIYFERFN